ncbi:hypothetical protein MMC16_001907 [Acarospora aff. strigata]|nr:hypothetical protein [Acarospora aff. strigata]
MNSNESPGTDADHFTEVGLGEIKQKRSGEHEELEIPAQIAEGAEDVSPITKHGDLEGQARTRTDNEAIEVEEASNVSQNASAHTDSLELGLAGVPLPVKRASPVANDQMDGIQSYPLLLGIDKIGPSNADLGNKLHGSLMDNQSCTDGYALPLAAPLEPSSYEEVSAPLMALAAAQSMLLAPDDELMADAPFLEPALSIVESEAPRIQAFAKLEFDDGQFYMNTYSVELGRDIRAARLAFQRDLETNQPGDVKVKRRSPDGEDASQTPSKVKREGSSRVAGSVVSETGGIMGVDMQDRDPKRRKKSKISKSTSSSSQYLSRKNSVNVPSAQTDYQSLAMASLSESTVGAHPVDPLSLLPSPDECPLIPIHPPAIAIGSAAGHKGISRKHVRIAFNFDKHLFEVEIKGKNGAFVDEQWHAPGEIRPLKSGSYIQIGGVGVRFVLPDVALGETGAETIGGSDPAQGGKMSFEFEDGRGESIAMADSSEDALSEDQELVSGDEEDEDDEEEVERGQSIEAEMGEESSVDEQSESGQDEPVLEKKEEPAKNEPSPDPPPAPPPLVKRKGPGRPPKNGIISKREQALIARKAREDAKKLAQDQTSPSLISTKGKGGKSKNETRPETPPPPKPEKRKYTKRKKAEPQPDGQSEQSQLPGQTSQAEGHGTEMMAPPKPPKEKKPSKPPRSPSPVFDESQMTPEQLAKPQSSYVVLIHEALTNSKTGAMSLPQIYRAIERRYPFYKLRVTTTGWQSSVRHNLSQHHAFRKVERDGKGWMWGLVPGVSIEKEKKRRPSPPPPPPQHYLQQGPSMQPPLNYPGMPPTSGYGQASIMPLQHSPYHSVPPGPGPLHHSLHPHIPPTNPISLPPPLLTAAQRDESSYQSPYQPPPQTQPLASQSQPQPQPPSQQPHPQPQPQPPPPSALQPQTQLQPPPTSSHNGANGFYANTRLSQAPPQQTNYQARTTPPNQPRPPVPQQQAYPTTAPQRSASVGQDVLQAVGKFKNALISSMPDKVRGEIIVTSAINRTLGLQNSSTVLGKEDPQEKAIMRALTGMLGNLSKKNEAAAAAANAARQSISGPSPQPTQIWSTPPQGQHLSPGPNGPPTQSQPQEQPAPQQQQHQQQQQQQYQQNIRPPSQAQQGAQVQLLQLLQQIGNRGSSSPSQQRPAQQSGSPVPASASQMQVNGAGHPSGSPVSAASVIDKSQSAPLSNGTGANETGEAVMTAQQSAPPPDVVASLKRPLEDGDAAPDLELPEAKKIAVG